MNLARFQEITRRFTGLRIAVLGDFCLDRYLEIDPAKTEQSIETGLPVHNVVNVRAQPGGAGTILNNLVALGCAEIIPVGFCGDDGEGYELRRALALAETVNLDHFTTTRDRRTFTYCKPLVLEPGQPPRELSRLDSKNWSPTPPEVEAGLITAVAAVSERVQALVVLNQVEVPETGVITRGVLRAVGVAMRAHPGMIVIGDSRAGFTGWPPMIFKMNASELGRVFQINLAASTEELDSIATDLAQEYRHPVFVTLSERGMLVAGPDGERHSIGALPLRGPIDVVGAGDAVTATLAATLAAGAAPAEAIELANAAASMVVHQLGTTGAATVAGIQPLLGL